MTTTQTSLQRSAFTTSRIMEFFTRKELTMQIGHVERLWPLALLKELIDNALDACESVGVAPHISITLEPDAVCVRDNGPGLPESVLERSLDYLVRVSDKAHYCSPSRGQLGNAPKCLWAANLWTPQKLWWNRLEDIRTLIVLRGWYNGVPVGQRNNFLLVAACAAAWGADATDLPDEINALAEEFCPTLNANEVRCHVQYTLREVMAGRRRKFTNERIIELLEISAEEQLHMQTLISNDLRAEYKRMANRKYSNRATYIAQGLRRSEQARCLQAQGLTYRQIAECMNTTPDAVDKLLRKPALPRS